jgi:hypothetical protein
MKVLFANLGTSDVKVKGEGLEDQRDGAIKLLNDLREVADEKDFVAAVAEDIQLPLLEAAIEKCGGVIDLLVIFVTDQPRSVGEKIWKKDTVETGKLVKFLYENNIGRFSEKVRQIEQKIISGQPNLYDEMLRLYPGMLNELGNIMAQMGGRKADEVYISITAGTPACNLALLYASVNAITIPGFKRYLYTSEREGRADFLQMQTMISRLELLNLVDRLLDRWDYDGVMKLVEASSDRSSSHLINMLKALESRLNFRFEDIDTDLRGSISSYEGEIFQQLMSEVTTIKEAADLVDTEQQLSHSGPLYNEIFWNMAIRYEVGNFLDFIGRFYRLIEGLLRFEACRVNKCSIVGLKNVIGINTEKPTRGDLHEYIKRPDANANPVLVKWCAKTDDLVKARHGITHGMLGLSRRRIEKLWKGDILSDTRKMLEQYFGMNFINPFDKYNEWLKEYCRDVL